MKNHNRLFSGSQIDGQEFADATSVVSHWYLEPLAPMDAFALCIYCSLMVDPVSKVGQLSVQIILVFRSRALGLLGEIDTLVRTDPLVSMPTRPCTRSPRNRALLLKVAVFVFSSTAAYGCSSPLWYVA